MSGSKMRVSLVAAFGTNWAIGKDNGLPWGGLPRDMKRFRDLTFGRTMAMGRSTFESLGSQPLPNRSHIILSNTLKQSQMPSGCLVAPSVMDAILIARAAGETELFFIGGTRVFREAMALAHRMYLTLIHQSFLADAFFPEFDFVDPNWSCSEFTDFSADADNRFEMTFFTLESRVRTIDAE